MSVAHAQGPFSVMTSFDRVSFAKRTRNGLAESYAFNVKSWRQMDESEKKASYKYSGVGFLIASVVTVIGTQDLFAGLFNGLILALVFQIFYQIRL